MPTPNSRPTTPAPLRSRLLLSALALAAVVIAGCGDDRPTADPATTTSQPAPTQPATTQPAPLSVAEAIDITDDQLHDVTGFVVTVDQMPRLCAALAESDPPQCGEPSLALAGEPTSNLDALFDRPLDNSGDVTWSTDAVTVTGAVLTPGTGDEPELWIIG